MGRSSTSKREGQGIEYGRCVGSTVDCFLETGWCLSVLEKGDGPGALQSTYIRNEINLATLKKGDWNELAELKKGDRPLLS